MPPSEQPVHATTYRTVKGEFSSCFSHDTTDKHVSWVRCNLPGGGGLGPVVESSGVGAPVAAVEAGAEGASGMGAVSAITIYVAIKQIQEKR
jgi:hypothetical protein